MIIYVSDFRDDISGLKFKNITSTSKWTRLDQKTFGKTTVEVPTIIMERERTTWIL